MSLNTDALRQAIKGLGENAHQSTVMNEVSKALGYGPVTTDIDLLRQGGAASTESLDPIVAEMILERSSFTTVNGLKKSQAGQILDQWDETTDLGGADGMTISNMDGTTKEATRGIRRRWDYIKFQTSRYSVNRPTVEAPNFMKGLNTQDVDAVTRILRDRSWQVYEGDESVDPDQINGVSKLIADPDRGNWDGRNVIDIANASGFSTLDDDGFSNPADIEKAMISISRAIARPIVGIGQTPSLYMGPSVYRDLSAYKPFQAMQIQDGRTQGLTTGFILDAIANPFSGTANKATVPVVDNFLPDDNNDYFKSAEEKGTAVVVTLPTVATPTVTTAVDSAFTARFAGVYNYFIAPLGREISDSGYEGVALRVPNIAVAAGKEVAFDIVATSGAKESGYGIYRTAPGAPNDIRHARLIKRIGRTGNSTRFVDKNRELPGASKLYLLDWTNPRLFMWRYLLSPSRINLPLNAQAVFNTPAVAIDSGYLQVKRPRHLGMIQGYVSREGGFSPLKGLVGHSAID